MVQQNLTTYNQLENKHFKLIIDRLPHVGFFCTSASVPGLSTTSPRVFSPFSDVKATGDKLVFQPLIVNFIVDEDLSNWQELYNWMVSYGHPTGFDEYKDNVHQKGLYASKLSDAKLLIPNNKYNTHHEFSFVDAFPLDISDMVFDIQIADTQVQICTVTFEYTYYKKTK